MARPADDRHEQFEKGLPVKWSTAAGENIAWKLAMPSRSGATLIIWGDTLFLNVATQPESGDIEPVVDQARHRRGVGKRPLAAGNFKINKQNMSSPSPVTDGRTVWVLTGLGS